MIFLINNLNLKFKIFLAYKLKNFTLYMILIYLKMILNNCHIHVIKQHLNKYGWLIKIKLKLKNKIEKIWYLTYINKTKYLITTVITLLLLKINIQDRVIEIKIKTKTKNCPKDHQLLNVLNKNKEAYNWILLDNIKILLLKRVINLIFINYQTLKL